MVVCLVDLVKLWPVCANVGQLFFTAVFLVHLQQNAWSAKMKAMRWLEVQRSETSTRSGWTESRVWLYSGTAVHTGWTFGIDITSVVRLLVKTQYTREHTPSDRAELWCATDFQDLFDMKCVCGFVDISTFPQSVSTSAFDKPLGITLNLCAYVGWKSMTQTSIKRPLISTMMSSVLSWLWPES